MSRAPFFVLTALVLVFLVSCVDRDPTSPEEQVGSPNFSSHLSECWPDDVIGQINALFPEGGTRAAALKMYRNILRDVDRGRLRNALVKAETFDRFVSNHSPDRLEDPCGDGPDDLPTQDQAEVVLVGNVYAVAGGNPPLVIPPEAYEPTGGVGLIDPVTGGVVLTNNMEAAVVADPDAFDGTGLVTIVLTRLPDPVVGLPPGSGPIPGYQAFPEGYDILSSRQLVPEANGGSGAIVELCVVLESVPPDIEPRLVIGHDLGGGNAELLYPRLDTNEVVCGGAGGYDPEGEVVAVEGAASPWLNLARRVIAPAKRLFGPQPLNAMYFAGRGLGGRTTSFSNFAPVDPWSLSVSPESATLDLNDEVAEVELTATLLVPTDEDDEPVDPVVFTWTSSDEGIATVVADGPATEVDPGVWEGTATVTGLEEDGVVTVEASYDGLSATSEITAEYVVVEAIIFGSGRSGNVDIWIQNTDGTGVANLTNDPATDNNPTWSPYGYEIAFSSDRSGSTRLHTMNADGTGVSGPLGTTPAVHPDWSTDYILAFSNNVYIYTMDYGDGGWEAPVQLGTVSPATHPAWSPDGTQLAITVGTQPNRTLAIISASGGSPTLLTSGADDIAPDWSPDGSEILFQRTVGGNTEVFVVPSTGGTAVNLTNDTADDAQPSWSADGTRIAFWSNRDGTSKIWVMNRDGSGTPAAISTGPDFDPQWRPPGEIPQ